VSYLISWNYLPLADSEGYRGNTDQGQTLPATESAMVENKLWALKEELTPPENTCWTPTLCQATGRAAGNTDHEHVVPSLKNYMIACGRPTRTDATLLQWERTGSWNPKKTCLWWRDKEPRLIPKPECMGHAAFSACLKLTTQGIDSWMDIPMWKQQKEAGGVNGSGLEQLWKGRHRGWGKVASG